MKQDFLKCVNFQFVSINVQAVKTKYFFPDLPNLRDVYVQRIHAYFSNTLFSDVNKVPSLTGTPGVANGAFMTLNKGSDEIFKQLEVSLIHPFFNKECIFNPGDEFVFDNINIDFSKSYIQISTLNPAPPVAFNFGVFYIKKSDLVKK